MADCSIFVLTKYGGYALMEDRPDLKPGSKHYWVFPGGKVEPNETPEAAMIREAWEEVGIIPTIFELLVGDMHSQPIPGTKSFRSGSEGWKTRAYLVQLWQGLSIPRKSLDTGAPLAWIAVEPIARAEPDGYTCNVEIARGIMCWPKPFTEWNHE